LKLEINKLTTKSILISPSNVRNAYKMLLNNIRVKRDQWGILLFDLRILLKWILEKQCGFYSAGFRCTQVVGFWKYSNELLGSIKARSFLTT
jgi:hypothetical protein